MKDFLSYTGGDGGDDGRAKSGGAQNENAHIASLAASVAASLDGKGEGAILNAVIAEAKRSRKAGTLSDADLENFFDMLSPLIDNAKRGKLRQVIDKLKGL